MTIMDTIDWNTLGICNLRCLHCYGPNKKIRALPHDQLMRIIERMKVLGVKRVILTGGEPLLTPNIVELFQRLSDEGIEIALSTNGTFVEEYWDAISKYVSSLNIPLDGHTPETHALSRADTSTFYTNLAILRKFEKSTNNRPKMLRVGTVFSGVTKGLMEDIAKLLLPFSGSITTWKVYELINHETQQGLRRGILHRPDDFGTEISRIWNVPELQPLISKTMIASSRSRDRAYFMLNPLAQVVVPTNVDGVTIEKVIGHFLHDEPEDLLQRWSIAVDVQNYQTNHRTHYGE